MVQLTVPARHRDAMTAVAGLSAQQVTGIADFIDTVTANRRQVRDHMTSVIGNDLAFDALVALNATRLAHGISAGDAVAQMLSSLSSEDLQGAFAPLLEHPMLVRFAKVLDLSAAVEKRIHTARVLTDLRPVFQEDPSKEVDAVLINHTLQLVVLGDSGFDESFIAVDLDDLRALRTQIDRALAKEESARRLVGRAGAEVVDANEEIE